MPEAEQCGWVKDRYGVSWQVGPRRMDEMMRSGTPQQIHAEVRDAITQTGGSRHIVGAGCTIPIDIPEDRIRAARAAVEK